MSEPLTISELLACVLGGDYLNYGSDAEVLADIARMLPDRDAKLIARAQREQMEADCRAQCRLCANATPAHVQDPILKTFGWWHSSPRTGFCSAANIRAAWAKAHPAGEAKGDEDGKRQG